MDTIVYKIHNVAEYKIFSKAIELFKNNGKGEIMISEDDIEALKGQTDFRKVWINIDKNLAYVALSRIEKHVKSSSNYINVFYDVQNDFCKIEFSIPKFLFANNVVELIPGHMSKHYKPGRHSMLKLTKYWMTIIISVIEQIFLDLTNGMEKVKLVDVEISRIDICYNQIYDSRDDALFLLESMKRQRIPKNSETMYHAYNTSMDFNNPRYYWKIYHKGAEFAANGVNDVLKSIKKFGDQKKKIPRFLAETAKNIDKLQDYADRILRYELECKQPMLNYIFNHKLKKKHIDSYRAIRERVNYIHDEALEYYNHYSVYYLAADGSSNAERSPRHNFAFYFLPSSMHGGDGNEMSQVRDIQVIMKLDKMDNAVSYLRRNHNIRNKNQVKALWKFYQKEDNRSHSFFLDIPKINDAEECTNQKGVLKGNLELNNMACFDKPPKNQFFSLTLLAECIKMHNKFFKLFQFKHFPEIDDSIKKVDIINEKRQFSLDKNCKMLRKTAVINFLILLKKYKTIEGIKAANLGFNKNQYARWRKLQALLAGHDSNLLFKKIESKYITDIEHAYKKHYALMLNSQIPLPIFLETHKFHI